MGNELPEKYSRPKGLNNTISKRKWLMDSEAALNFYSNCNSNKIGFTLYTLLKEEMFIYLNFFKKIFIYYETILLQYINFREKLFIILLFIFHFIHYIFYSFTNR